MRAVLVSPIENCTSRLTENDSKGLTDLLFSMLGLRMVKSVSSIMSLVQDTLLALQAKALGIDLHSEVKVLSQVLLVV